MNAIVTAQTLTYQERLNALRATKLAHTSEKIAVTGYKDHDDHALILPPPDRRKIVQTMSSSGMPIKDCLLEGYEITPNHPGGGFYGAASVGENFRRLLEVHPTYVDPNSSLLGNYMVNFLSYRKQHWNPEFDFSYLQEEIDRYKLLPGIGAVQHFCQDLQIGLELGWGGILEKIRHYRQANAPHGGDFYDGLEDIVLGLQNWIYRNAQAAQDMLSVETDPTLRENLEKVAAMNFRLISARPETFWEACQWILWYQIMARMFNGSGSLGRLDVLLYPYYQKDLAEGILTDEEAIFHLCCLLLRDTAYSQLGGPDADGRDVTNPVSYLVLEAAHRLRIPANVGICVGDQVDAQLLRRGVEIMLQDKCGIPKFLGVEVTARDFAKNGYPLALGRERAYSGCHWSAIPGREYTVNDCVKINFA